MNDLELLELAAKAAGLEVKAVIVLRDGTLKGLDVSEGGKIIYYWHPLADDGDALRLAVKLRIIVGSHGGGSDALFDDQKGGEGHIEQDFGEDGSLSEIEAYRRAVVRAAAEIGKAIQAAQQDPAG